MLNDKKKAPGVEDQGLSNHLQSKNKKKIRLLQIKNCKCRKQKLPEFKNPMFSIIQNEKIEGLIIELCRAVAEQLTFDKWDEAVKAVLLQIKHNSDYIFPAETYKLCTVEVAEMIMSDLKTGRFYPSLMQRKADLKPTDNMFFTPEIVQLYQGNV